MTEPDAETWQPQGIKKADFIDNVEEWMKKQTETSVPVILDTLQKDFAQYKQQERRLINSREVIKSKLPELDATIDALERLKDKLPKEDVVTNYEVSFGVYGKAKLKKSNKVNLWLGANVMVEYTIDDALELLQGNRKGAEKKLDNTEKTLDFVQDQVTTLQVSMARIHNWDITKKKAAAGK